MKCKCGNFRTILLGAALAITGLAIGCANTAREEMVTLHAEPANGAGWTKTESWYRELRIIVVVKINKEERDKFLAWMQASTQDRRSPYRTKGISNEEYRRRFWPPPDRIKELTDWLSSQGFEILEPDNNGLQVTGWVTTAEKAFATTIMESPDGRCYATKTEPQIPARFADLVEAIVGLDHCEENFIALPGSPHFVH